MLKIKEIVTCTNGKLIAGNMAAAVKGISTDSRNINKGELFIAIKGPHFDGHDFIDKALEKKAQGLLVAKAWVGTYADKIAKIKIPIIIVPDTVIALGQIAHFYRKKFNIPIIAVTGSNGKTTTKEMIATVLCSKYKVLKSPASFNNYMGVPLTLLKLNALHKAAVLEMGMNHKGEIRDLSAIAKPDIAVITNAGRAHLEFFHSPQEVIQAKCELVEKLGKGAIAVVNADQTGLFAQAKKLNVKLIGFGIKNDCRYRASNIMEANGGLEFVINKKHKFRLNILGRHNVYNALAAIAVADQLGLDMQKIQRKLMKFQGLDLRMQKMVLNGIEIFADCYNANPDSTQAAIETLIAVKNKKRKILVFADMLELGKFSKDCHYDIGKLAAKGHIDVLITVGTAAAEAAKAAQGHGMSKQSVFSCTNCEEAYRMLTEILQPKDVILLKGSRRMRLEQILEKIVNMPSFAATQPL